MCNIMHVIILTTFLCCRFAHRLDFATSGALCLALTRKAASKTCACFVKRRVTKHYIALVGNMHIINTMMLLHDDEWNINYKNK